MIYFSTFLRELDDNAIFRYTPFNQYSLKTLINHKLYFGNLLIQNDPIDAGFIIDINKIPKRKPLTSISKAPSENEEKKLWYFIIQSRIQQDYGICCFSEKIRKILLWSHYTGGSEGFCMVFDKEELISSLQLANNSMRIGNVKYNGLPIITPEINIMNSKYDVDNIKYDVDSIAFNKLHDWKYESEVRILCEFKKNSGFSKPINSFNFSPNSLKSIIVGERMQNENIITLKNILKLPGYENVVLFKILRNKLKPQVLQFKSLQRL